MKNAATFLEKFGWHIDWIYFRFYRILILLKANIVEFIWCCVKNT